MKKVYCRIVAENNGLRLRLGVKGKGRKIRYIGLNWKSESEAFLYLATIAHDMGWILTNETQLLENERDY